jgi:branched-chain amino acid transport system ATP-binding protein
VLVSPTTALETSNVAEPWASATPILSVKNIEVIYDHVILVLRGVSFVVPQGKIVALLRGKRGWQKHYAEISFNAVSLGARGSDQGLY